MKAIFCKECKWNANGWCHKFKCNGKKRVELCTKYSDPETEVCNYCKHNTTIEINGVVCNFNFCPFCGRKLI